MRLKYHVVTENKDMFEKQKCKGMWKERKSKTERDQWAKLKQFAQHDK